MKRKVALLSLAMMAGMPPAICAKGMVKADSATKDAYGASSYTPQLDEPTPPLMVHLPVPDPLPRSEPANEWQVELAPPSAVGHRPDDPLMGRDKRVGVTFKLDF